MPTREQYLATGKPPRLLQVKLPEEVDILLRTIAIKDRRHLKDLVIDAILKTYGPQTPAGDQ